MGGYFRRDPCKTGLTLKRCNQLNVFAIQLVDGDGAVVWLLESAKPLCARIKGASGRFLRVKLISDDGLFPFYEVQQGKANRHDVWAFFQGWRDLWTDGILARPPASPAEDLHRRGPRFSNPPYCCIMTCGLEKLGLVDQT